MKTCLFTALFLFLGSPFFAQNQAEPSGKNAPLALIGKNDGQRITLRWAPGTPGAWLLGNRFGYRLERMRFRDKNDAATAEFLPIGGDTLRPWPLDRWEPIAKKSANDPYATAAAQAIFGKKTQETGNQNLFERGEELKNLFATALLAADFSKNAATAAALRFEDKDVQTGFTHVYRLVNLGASIDYPIDTAYLTINTSDVAKPSRPMFSAAEEGDRAVHLVWDRARHEALFTAYYIEKSDDNGRNFRQLNREPFLQSPLAGADDGFIHFVDSLEKNYRPTLYRLRGLDAFADLSTPSDTIQAMGRDRTPPRAPQNVRAEHLGNGRVQISWDFDKNVGEIVGFTIARSPEPDAGHLVLTKNMLPASARSFIDNAANELGQNFYTVGVLDTAGNGSVANSVLVVIIDSIAPAPPQGLDGSIDTNGVVSLRWLPGKEPDLAGYAVHSANSADHVFINLTNLGLRDTFFTDTIPLNVLTEAIFYRVTALDHRQNVSEYSATLQLKKPDRVPPVAPVFENYQVGKGFIQINWAPSESRDVASHALFRRKTGEANWVALGSFSKKNGEKNAFLDKNIEPSTDYEYLIKAMDDAGLWTSSPFLLTVRSGNFAERPKPGKPTAIERREVPAIELRWASPEKIGEKIIIYRAENNGAYRTLDLIEADQSFFLDKTVATGKAYSYRLKAVFANGLESDWSEAVEVQF